MNLRGYVRGGCGCAGEGIKVFLGIGDICRVVWQILMLPCQSPGWLVTDPYQFLQELV